MPRKAKRLALRSILSERMNASAVKIVEDFTVESGKTKDMVAILSGIVEPDRVVFVFHQNDEQTRRASRNIPWLRTLSCNRLNAHDLYYSKTILLTESAAQALGDILKTKKGAAEVTHAE
jgi:large subunit ribosomal protein L4